MPALQKLFVDTDFDRRERYLCEEKGSFLFYQTGGIARDKGGRLLVKKTYKQFPKSLVLDMSGPAQYSLFNFQGAL
jgi:hypothetical protein